MRTRLALFVVLWIVFAPGWNHDDGGVAPPEADLGPRVLAPTFTEAAIADAGRGDGHNVKAKALQRRPHELPRDIVHLALLAAAALASFARSWTVLEARSRSPQRATLVARHQVRAPPFLQPA